MKWENLNDSHSHSNKRTLSYICVYLKCMSHAIPTFWAHFIAANNKFWCMFVHKNSHFESTCWCNSKFNSAKVYFQMKPNALDRKMEMFIECFNFIFSRQKMFWAKFSAYFQEIKDNYFLLLSREIKGKSSEL